MATFLGPAGVGADRQRAAAAQLGEEGPLAPPRAAGHQGRRWPPVPAATPASSCAALDRQRALSHLRDEGQGLEDLGGHRRGRSPAQAIGRRLRHHHRRHSPGPGLGQPPGHVAAQAREGEVGSEVGQLRPSPRRAGGDQRPGGKTIHRAADEEVPGVGALGEGSRRRARGRTTPATPGRSLAECTAASASPRATAACTSRTKTPRPPRRSRGTPAAAVTLGLDRDRLAATPAPRRRSATRSACHRASGEARVASRTACPGPHHQVVTSTGQRWNRVRSASTSRSPRGVPDASFRAIGGIVQQLGDHRLRHRVDLVPLAVVEGRLLLPATLELRPPHLVEPGPERGDDRGGVARPRRHPVALDRLGDDGRRRRHLLPPPGDGVGHGRPRSSMS